MRRTGRADALAALAEVGGIGPFFAVETGARTSGWRPVTDLYANADGSLDGLVGVFAEQLRTTERRVAASILFQGCAARLWSPVLACVARTLPVPDLGGLCWRYRPGETFGLLVTEPDAVAYADADAVSEIVIGGHLRPLAAALRERSGVAVNLLWGNASSAMIGTLTVLRSAGEPIGPALDMAMTLLAREPLQGTGTLTVDAEAPAFRRRSCCLYYRVPGGGLCGDCSLRD